MSSDQAGFTGRTKELGGHYHFGSWYTDEECHCILSTIPHPFGPLCLYWGDTEESEDAVICGHKSCYLIVHGQLDQDAIEAMI